MESEGNTRYGTNWRKVETTQTETRRIGDTLENKERYLKSINDELYSIKSLLNSKEDEVLRLKEDQATYEEEIMRGENNVRLLEDEVRALRHGHLSAKKNAEALAYEAEHLSSERAAMGSRVRDMEDEIVYLRQKVRDEETRLEAARIAKERRDAELAAMKYREEMDTWNVRNARLEAENRELEQRITDVELQVMKLKRRCEHSSLLLEDKSKDLSQLRMSLSYSPRRSESMYAELRKVKEDNDSLQRMLDRYREDANFQKRLTEIEAAKKIELEIEKKRLESEALSKDLEARMARRELERVKDTRGMLLEDRSQINEELDALKKHAEVLEDQNAAMNNELERFVETDERVRRDLDRKYKVDYLKSKNSDQLQKSFARVVRVTSPKRSPYSSPYRSPSKY